VIASCKKQLILHSLKVEGEKISSNKLMEGSQTAALSAPLRQIS